MLQVTELELVFQKTGATVQNLGELAPRHS